MKAKQLAKEILGDAKKDEADDIEGEEPKMPDGKEVAKEFLDAVEAKDAAAVWKAFRGLSACASESPDEEEAEGDEQE